MRILYFASMILMMALSACTNNNRKAVSADIDKNEATPQNPVSNGPLGTPEFVATTHNFGKIIDGEKVQHKFKFKNVGKGELTLAKVEAHCGCTTPEWTRDIIAPGGEGFILATFDSNGRGEKDGVDTEKGITVEFANSSVKSIELTLKSTIFKKD